jgi:alkylated DNA repair dioxygenase AlkB
MEIFDMNEIITNPNLHVNVNHYYCNKHSNYMQCVRKALSPESLEFFKDRATTIQLLTPPTKQNQTVPSQTQGNKNFHLQYKTFQDTELNIKLQKIIEFCTLCGKLFPSSSLANTRGGKETKATHAKICTPSTSNPHCTPGKLYMRANHSNNDIKIGKENMYNTARVNMIRIQNVSTDVVELVLQTKTCYDYTSAENLLFAIIDASNKFTRQRETTKKNCEDSHLEVLINALNQTETIKELVLYCACIVNHHQLSFLKENHPNLTEDIAWLELLVELNPRTTVAPKIITDWCTQEKKTTQLNDDSTHPITITWNSSIQAVNIIKENNCIVELIPRCITNTTELFTSLAQEAIWTADTVHKHATSRYKAYMADNISLNYAYNGFINQPTRWHPLVEALKTLISHHLQITLNAALLIYYSNGDIGLGYHADNEPHIVPDSTIVSISLGATRTIHIRKIGNSQSTYDKKITLCSGDLFVMKGCTQRKYEHSIPKDPNQKEARIAITFRLMRIITNSP